MDLILDVASLGQASPYLLGQVVGRIAAAGKVAKAIQKGMRAAEVKVQKGVEGKQEVKRDPTSIQDQMALDAAKKGAGDRLIANLKDPKYKGMEKFEYKVKSKDGKDSVVHYVKDPKTGRLMDFKFKKRSTD